VGVGGTHRLGYVCRVLELLAARSLIYILQRKVESVSIVFASFAAAKLHHIARRAQPSSSLAEYVPRYSRSASLYFSGNRWPDVAGTTGYEFPSGGYFVDHVEDDYVE